MGIAAMPFLHANLPHILSNTVPLFVLLVLLAGSRAESWEVVVLITVLGGLLLWIFGREAVHIGASGLISGLGAFLILSGFLERRIIPILIALVVGFFYGSAARHGRDPPYRLADFLGRPPLRSDRRRDCGPCAGPRSAAEAPGIEPHFICLTTRVSVNWPRRGVDSDFAS